MLKVIQNLVLLVDPFENETGPMISLKAANMCVNRFCIDEDAAFEISGIYDITKTFTDKEKRIILGQQLAKGKVNLSPQCKILVKVF